MVTNQGYKLSEAELSVAVNPNLFSKWRERFAQEASGTRLTVTGHANGAIPCSALMEPHQVLPKGATPAAQRTGLVRKGGQA